MCPSCCCYKKTTYKSKENGMSSDRLKVVCVTCLMKRKSHHILPSFVCLLSTKYTPCAQQQASNSPSCMIDIFHMGQQITVTYFMCNPASSLVNNGVADMWKHISSVAWVWWEADKIISLSTHTAFLLGNLLCLCPVAMSRSYGS